ncbi:MAG: phosphonoacetate hydrolase [Pseudomonadota bacterium]
MNNQNSATITVNGRDYAEPSRPAIAICLDGCEPAYLVEAMNAGLMPNLKRIMDQGAHKIAHSVIPSFTNPNNMSIATGRPPEVHGICGNFLIDPDTGEAVMMNDPKWLRAPTVFKAFQDAGKRVAIVTAKDKLRALLGKDLAFDGSAICFSSERADQTTEAENGIGNASEWLGEPVPEVYSAALSEFVFAAGVKLLAEFKPDLMYLTTTDYIQHKHAPGDKVANDFYAAFDGYLGILDEMGAGIAVTADHGMKPKHNADGSPAVVYVQDMMDGWVGAGRSKVILPITDPYVVHHGALGSFATIYLPDDADRDDLVGKLSAVDGVATVVTKEQGCAEHQLPPDRIGDIILTTTENMTVGTSESEHDLTGLDAPLRSHGGLTEQQVPMIVNAAVDLPDAPKLRNFDVLHYACRAAA